MTKLTLITNYVANHNARNLINFLQRLNVICYESNDGGLSHKPYKIAIAVKSLDNYSNPKPNNPHGFKEELKIKFKTTLAIDGKFPNRTGVIEQLLKAKKLSLTWDDYCGMTPTDWLIWEEKADAPTKAMLFLMNPKTKIAKKILCLAFA